MSLLQRLPSAGSTFAGFYLEAEVGRGGAGAVFRARAPDGRVLALKVLMRDLREERHRLRFEREAIAGQALRHPGAVAVYGAGVEQGLGYILMELLEGALPLDVYVAQGPCDLPTRLRLFAEVCEAVQAAHDVGLIHRDLKPDNVLVTAAGRAKVLDLGLARHLELERLTQSGVMMGTLFYMAPEQIRGDTAHADARTDVYSLGVILYELVAGRLPFRGEGALEVMRQTLEEQPPPLAPEHAAYEAVIRLALAKEPDQRYPTVRALALDLAASESSCGTAASGILAAQRRRRALRVGGLGLVTCALLGGAALYFQFGAPAPDPRRLAEARLRELCASGAPLASHALAISALEAPEDAPELAAELERLRALLSYAQGQATTLVPGETALGEAGAGVLALRSSDPQAAERLTRALRAGLEWADLYRWRALAEGESEGAPRRAARQILADAARWRAAAQPPLLPPDERLLAAEARAYVAQGQLDEARALLAELSNPPTILRWEFALACVEPALPTRPLEAHAALLSLAPGPPPPSLAEPAADAAHRALQALAQLSRTGIGVRNEAQAVALLKVQRRLDPETLPAESLRRALVEACNGLRAPILLELGVTIGDGFPEDAFAQRELALVARRLDKGLQRRLFPVIRRAIQFESDRAARFEQELAFVYLLAHTNDPTTPEIAEFEQLLARLLPRVEDDAMRAVLVSARGRLFMARGAHELARRDLLESIEYDPSFALSHFLLFELERDRSDHAQALRRALAYMERDEHHGGRREIALTYAWERRADPLAREILRCYLKADAGHGGWWIRLALLEESSGEDGRARAAVARGRELLDEAADAEQRAIGRSAAAALERPDAAGRLAGLRRAVEALDALRGNRTFP